MLNRKEMYKSQGHQNEHNSHVPLEIQLMNKLRTCSYEEEIGILRI